MEAILTPVAILSVLGAIFAFLLGIVSKITYIPIDETLAAVQNALPGVNCGACGYTGCNACAEAIVAGEAPTSACTVGGEPVAEEIAEILGVSNSGAERQVASVLCQGDCHHTEKTFEYDGVSDCRILNESFGGNKSCSYGCLGCGTCKDSCDYGAIEMVDGVAVIDEEKCVSCMACIKICPKEIIELVPYHAPAQVKCMNPGFGKPVSANCSIGCIGCGICVRTAENEFEMQGKLARPVYHENFDLEKASQAAEKCPGNCITIDPNYQTVKVEEKEPVAEA